MVQLVMKEMLIFLIYFNHLYARKSLSYKQSFLTYNSGINILSPLCKLLLTETIKHTSKP